MEDFEINSINTSKIILLLSVSSFNSIQQKKFQQKIVNHTKYSKLDDSTLISSR